MTSCAPTTALTWASQKITRAWLAPPPDRQPRVWATSQVIPLNADTVTRPPQTFTTDSRSISDVQREHYNHAGYSLIELMLVITLVALMSAFAIPAYNGYIEDARVSAAVGDIAQISLEIDKFRMNNNGLLPASLADIDLDTLQDPWGNNYRYLDITNEVGKGNLRKDKNLNPLNSDFDLYSVGPDGSSRLPLSARASLDDVVRANNGAFIGLAEDY